MPNDDRVDKLRTNPELERNITSYASVAEEYDRVLRAFFTEKVPYVG